MTRLATVPWAVVLDVPHDVYRKPLFAAAGALAVAIGIVTLVSIAGGGLAGRRLSRAVATLTQTLTPPGNGTALAEIEAVRDILQRASAARDASEQALRDSKEQLRLAAISLEQRVKERTAELQMANHELEAFSYSVSHDLRAPLRAIDGFSLAVLEDYGNQLDDEGRTYLERVRKASQRMAHLIDDLLQLSRIGRSELNYVTVDLSAIAREVADEFNAQDPQRRVVWQLEEGICLQADANLMRIVMVNLLGNAWKFSAPRAEAQISFGRTVWQGQPALYVSDNGAGFEMQYADRLFQPFQRLHAETEFPGTGIGLAIVQRIIHRHNGTVAAEGEPGQGARFYFSVGGAHARGQDNSAG